MSAPQFATTFFSISIHSYEFSGTEILVPFSPDWLSANTIHTLWSESISMTEEWHHIFIDLCSSASVSAWAPMRFTGNNVRQNGQVKLKMFCLEGGVNNL